MKNSNDTIGNGTRDLPACSAVPQPTAQPRTPTRPGTFIIKYILDVVLDGCIVYRLLLVLTQRDVLYQN